MSKLLGSGDFTYELVKGWGALPDGWSLGPTGVATDSQDRVYLANRSAHPLVVLDSDGAFLKACGEGVVTSPHGIFIDSNDHLYLPQLHAHTVLKCDIEGNVLMTMGKVNVASNPDWSGELKQYLQSPPPASYGPFCGPTDVALAPDGAIYVSDGYGNASIHRFTSGGTLIGTFGRPGSLSPGAFHTPHGIWVAQDGRVFVADRENHRLQIFSPEGEFLAQWTGFESPCDIFIDTRNIVYVAEGGGALMTDAMVSILSIDGEFLTRWKGPAGAPGHAIWVDTKGCIYVNQILEGQRILKFQPIA